MWAKYKLFQYSTYVILIFAVALVAGNTATQAADNFAAIAYSQDTDSHGWSYDYSTRGEAEARAMVECAQYGRGCKIATWCKNACCALAVGRGNGWGADWGRSKDEAQRLAVRRCHTNTSNCSVRRWVCTTR